MFYTYLLQCVDEKRNRQNYYVGVTGDLKQRIKDHQMGKVRTTRNFEKVFLIYYEACLNKTDASKRELQLKTGFGRGYIKRRLESYFRAGLV